MKPILLALMSVAAFAAEKKRLPTAFTIRRSASKMPLVIAAWKKVRDSGNYKSVFTISGKMRKHYGLTDPKEFFAEMTECYFGSNDFYPFVSGELKQAEPEIPKGNQ